MNKAELIEELLALLDEDKVLVGTELEERYHHIWKMNETLSAVALVMPSTTEEVSAVLKFCHKHKQPLSIHGGLTNLVGGTETKAEELVVSLEKMNSIIEVDEGSRTMTVEAGVILHNIQEAAKENALFFPLNFGAKGSAMIGGIISTNAGGLRVFRYGMTRNLVLGLEAVLANGTIVSSLKKIIKDNSGYDLKQLFIGSEGTLGVVTKAVLKLHEAPASRTSAMVAMDNYDKVIKFLKLMDRAFGGKLSGFELMWDNYYTMATSLPAMMKPPLEQGAPYYVLIESLGNDQEAEQGILVEKLEHALEQELIIDAVLADTATDFEWFWKIREDVHAITSQFAEDQHFDISLPIPLIGVVLNDIITQLNQIPGVEKVVSFGHLADGNIHIIVGKSDDSAELTAAINKVVYAPLKAIGGSVSAEHGIGVHKKAYLHLCRSEAEIELMKTLKKALDPDNILNRGRIFEI